MSEKDIERKFYLVGECKDEVQNLLGKPITGAPTQFESFKHNITYVKGYHCLVAAAPTSGKSYWVMSECVNLAKRDNALIMLFTPEMGDKAQIVALLLHMYTGKSIYKREGVERLEGVEFENAQKWLNNHFVIIDTDTSMTIRDIYDQVDLFRNEYKKQIDYLVIDNLNDTDEEIGKYGGRQDLAIEGILSNVRRFNKKREMFTFLVTHSGDNGQPITKEGVRYYLPLDPHGARGGKSLYRKAYLFITIWRPPVGLIGEDGEPYKENEAHVIVLKSKPDGTATKGFIGKIFYNWKTASFTDKVPPPQEGNWRELKEDEYQYDGDEETPY